MSDSNYCKDCHSRDCQCFPDYESPVDELDRLRKETRGLKARVTELEAEIAQLKSQDEWHDGIPPEPGWYWVQVYGRKPEVGEFEFFDCGQAGMRWNLHRTGMEEPTRPEDRATIKWKKVQGGAE
jgi:hypothetical protein